MRIAFFLFFLICLLGCSSFSRVKSKNLLSSSKKRTSNYNREYYLKNRERLKLRARERYRRNRKN
ncbi:hypothetical protein [Borreliella lusitaniae]|uniref:Lipoprotein n=1 Tax=Borreliella lusitaniae TaxID=100177 RepID=A0ABZ0CIU0_9SPIR|nr:hypothetical protein [Borreliella lusitaniae]WKC84913.1 hypothetical protein QIA24_00490 [Borreliella lusitaniae]WNY69138.1 hypothetical protein QIA44_04735 [Borreliella lusitaniae]